MMRMLAEVIPNANALLEVLMVASFVLMLWEKVTNIFGRNDPKKREVSFAEQYVSREELKRIEGKLDKLEADATERRREIYDMIRDASKKAEHDLKEFRQETRSDFSGLRNLLEKNLMHDGRAA